MIGGNYVWCLDIFVILMRFAGAKRSGGDALKSSFRVAVQTIRDKGGGGDNLN